MHTITSSAAMATFLAQPLDPTLRRILTDRVEQLAEYDGYDLGELANFLIVQPGDTHEAIEAALRFSFATHDPEAVTDHGGWVEAAYLVSDDFGWLLLVPDAATTLASVLRRSGVSSEVPPSR